MLRPRTESALQNQVDYRPREQWTRKADFILTCIGFAVGLGNVWRFPYLCYKNGGGAFLIPYLTIVICAGIPLFFMELSIGQYMNEGGVSSWNLCPIFRGIGYGSLVLCKWCEMYYIVVLAWALLYMYYSFQSPLPWSTCGNAWNTENCYIATDGVKLNLTVKVDPVVEFWQRKILNVSSGADEISDLRFELLFSLAIVWVVCYFCVWKGVKSTGKVVYFTALFPYVMLVILFIRGVTLPGALNGIIFYLKPDFAKLFVAQVWMDAGTQIFYSYAVGFGALMSLGSYNHFNNNCYRDAWIISVINSSTSLFAGFVIFSTLGFMAHMQNVDISEVAESGPGLAFLVYPKAVSYMPWAPLWAVLFFFMILIVGLDSQFCQIEGLVTSIVDLYPHILRVGQRREIFIAINCLISFIGGIIFCTRGGIYYFQIFDTYAASGITLLWICFWETVALAWFYGAERFYTNIEQMIGYRPNFWFKLCWKFITPSICAIIFIATILTHKSLTYNKTYVYPVWAEAIGWFLTLSSAVCIPVTAVYYLLCQANGSLLERWKKLTTPVFKSRRPIAASVSSSQLQADPSPNKVFSSLDPFATTKNGDL